MVKTRSASKLEALELARLMEMTPWQRLTLKIDSITMNVAAWAFENKLMLILLYIGRLAIGYVWSATDWFEQVYAIISGKEFTPTDPPKDLTLIKYLGLDELFWFIVSNYTATICVIFPAACMVIYMACKSNSTDSPTRRHTKPAQAKLSSSTKPKQQKIA